MNDWEARYNSLLAENNKLTKKLDNAKQVIAILEAEKRQWTDQKDLQSQIIAQQLDTSDGTVNRLQDEIIWLKKEIKTLKAD